MKRATAYLLSFCLVFSLAAQTPRFWADDTAEPPVTEGVTETQPEAADSESPAENPDWQEPQIPQEDPLPQEQIPAESEETVSVSEEPEQLTDEEEPEQEAEMLTEAEASGPVSALELTLVAALPLQKDTVFQVTLEGPSARSGEAVLPAATSGTLPLGKLSLTGLENGTYTLTLRGAGFANYTQSFEVNSLVYEMQLYTDQISGFQSGKAPGVLFIGDVNGSGAVDGADLSNLIDVLEADGYDSACDLNGDGAVDLLDLQLLAGSYNSTINGQAFLSTRLPAAALAQTTAGEQTRVQGDVNDVLTSTGSVLLENTSGAITPDTPAVLDFDFAGEGQAPVVMEGMSIQSPLGTDSTVTQATIQVVYEDADGVEREMEIPVSSVATLARLGGVQQQADGTLMVDFGGQIAVKKVSLRITATSGSNLAEISKVEFLNDMESRIPAPQMDIPANVRVENGNREFTVSWDNAVNVTGYEVLVQHGGVQETYKTAVNQLTITRFAGEKLTNQTEYTVQVQSLNGEWRSGYSEAVIARPVATKKPAAPDYLTLTGKFQRIEASWKAMDDTDTYNVYYREADTGEYICVSGIATNSYTINGLKNNVRYQVYVTGVNDLGEGDPSLVAAASTANVTPPTLPAYQLINTTDKAGKVTEHITSVTHAVGFMKDSPLDEGSSTSALGVVDGDYTSFYQLNDWDDGATYPDNGGLRFTFDQPYHIGAIALAQPEDLGIYGHVRLLATDENGKEQLVNGVTIGQRTSENGRKYYYIKIPGGVTTQSLRLCVGHMYGGNYVTVAEVRFYAYDSLEDDIMALYADDLHITLKPEVDADTIAALRTRLDTPDPVSGEKHPEYSTLLKELENAEGLLDSQLRQTISIDPTITASADKHVGFTGLNAWQPLGVTAHAGEQIVIYVGHNTLKTGAKTNLQLIATQYNAEVSNYQSKPITLNVGRNEITIPQIQTLDTEQGGALYIQYIGSNASDQYSVRVSGGTPIAVLDLHGVTDAEQRLALTRTYVEQQEQQVAALEQTHKEQHQGSGIGAVDFDYNEQDCILGSTDIVLDQMMYSVSAQQLLAGLSGSLDEKAQQLCDSLDAMDQMMRVFYQHKGLTDAADAGEKNRLPAQHLNIRYHRMFAGAFMYAAGNHIGIGWGSVPGLAQGQPVVLDDSGRYVSGQWFGWGIAHEIGHNINQGSYAVAEVTNNYFSQISQSYEGVRFGYDAVYKKVTSNTTGPSSDVFTQLAMYWQLHLAYDTGYEYELYDNYAEITANRFFARVDSYSRNPSQAPGDVALKLGGNADQNFMRLASAAAEKDLTDFFTRWGMTPDETTAAYMAQFPAEERAIYYTNDSARNYAMEHPDAAGSVTGLDVVGADTTATVDQKAANQVHFQLTTTADPDAVLGYEIARVIYANGQPQRQVVGFSTGSTYTDTVTTLNNRTVTYEITVIDRWLNRSAVKTLEPVKIAHEGDYDKTLWSASTNMTSADDGVTAPGTEEDPCAPQPQSAIDRILDNDASTTYTGSASGEATITLDFHQTLAVTGLRYTATEGTPVQEYTVEVSNNGEWTTVASGTFTLEKGVAKLFFTNGEDPWVCTYDAQQLRLTVKAPKGEISVSELDVFGPTGDNIELGATEDGVPAIGRLTADYVYDESTGAAIPAGSILFTGTYKGNPAYNVVMVYDENGNVVGNVDAEGNILSEQIILAPVPEEGELGETSDGRWIYWLTPDQLPQQLPTQVRAELYRVDNALTNEGQRLVSDTLPVRLPDSLPDITIQ